MLYSYMGFNQEKVAKTELDMIDCALILYIKHAMANNNMAKYYEQDKVFVWLTYEKITSDNPIFKIQERSMYKRVDNLVNLGYVEKVVKCVSNTKDKRTYFTTTEKANNLLYENEFVKEVVEEQPKQEEKPQDNIPYKEVIDYLNKVARTNYRHTSQATQKFIRARFKEGFTLEDFMNVIDTKSRQWLGDSNMEKYLRPETLFGTKFEAYLNQKTTNCKEKGNFNVNPENCGLFKPGGEF